MNNVQLCMVGMVGMVGMAGGKVMVTRGLLLLLLGVPPLPPTKLWREKAQGATNGQNTTMHIVLSR